MSCCGNSGCNEDGRRFLTTQERVTRLEEYKDWLTNEAKGVDEAIVRLQKK